MWQKNSVDFRELLEKGHKAIAFLDFCIIYTDTMYTLYLRPLTYKNCLYIDIVLFQ